MGIFRLLILAGLAWLVWKMLQGWRIEVVRREPPAGGDRDYLPMSRCSACGLYLPKEGLSSAGRCGACEKAGR